MAVSQEKPVEANKQCQIKQKKGTKRKNTPPSNEEANPAVNRKETCAVIEGIPSGKSVKKFSGKSVKKPSGKSVKKKRAVQKKENVSEQGGVTDKVLNGVEGELVDNLSQNETADDPPRKKKKKKGENKGTHSENKGEEERVNSTSVIDQALETESAEARQTNPTQKRKKKKGNNPGTNLDDNKAVCVNGDDANVESKVFKRKRLVENGKTKKKRKIKGKCANSEVKESVSAKADSDKSTGGMQNDDKVGPHEGNNDEPETKKRKKTKLKINCTDKENDELNKKSDKKSEEAVKTGQWETATFENKESQKKQTCIKLLGGNKKRSDKKKLGKKLKVKKGDQSSDKQTEDEDAPPAKLAMTKIQERLLTIALESPDGLGFGNEGGNGNTYRKKFNFDFKDQDSFIKISHGDGILMIDPTVSKSIKFSDDD